MALNLRLLKNNSSSKREASWRQIACGSKKLKIPRVFFN